MTTSTTTVTAASAPWVEQAVEKARASLGDTEAALATARRAAAAFRAELESYRAEDAEAEGAVTAASKAMALAKGDGVRERAAFDAEVARKAQSEAKVKTLAEQVIPLQDEDCEARRADCDGARWALWKATEAQVVVETLIPADRRVVEIIEQLDEALGRAVAARDSIKGLMGRFGFGGRPETLDYVNALWRALNLDRLAPAIPFAVKNFCEGRNGYKTIDTIEDLAESHLRNFVSALQRPQS
jgi:hypothetical protein